MKSAQQSPKRLNLLPKHLSYRRLFRGLFWTGIGLGLLLCFGPAKLDCQRVEPTQVTCQLNKPGWLGLGVWRSQAIAHLQGVKLKSTLDEGMYYQILLQTSQGEVPLRPYKTSGLDNTRESVAQIQSFLDNPRENYLSISQVDWFQWFGLAPGIVFSLVGLRLLFHRLAP